MTGSAGGETTLVDKWIEDKLSENADAQDYFGVPMRVFEGTAPEGTTYPFVTYVCRLSVDVRGVGPDARVMNRSEYIIKATGEYSSYVPMQPYARLFDTLFGRYEVASGELVEGGSILSSHRIEEHRQTEPHEGRNLRHYGGIYSVNSYSDPS